MSPGAEPDYVAINALSGGESTAKSSHAPFAFEPFAYVKPRAKRERDLIRRGLCLMIGSLVVRTVITAYFTVSFDPSLATMTSALREVESEIGALKFMSLMAQLTLVGFGTGLALAVYGYAELFLKKQSVFEQQINHTLSVVAGQVKGAVMSVGSERGARITNVNESGGVVVGDYSSLKSRDINVFKQAISESAGFDDELKQKLIEARMVINSAEGIDQIERDDAIDDLRKLVEELKKERPAGSRIERLIENIARVAPAVVAILGTATRIVELVGRTMS